MARAETRVARFLSYVRQLIKIPSRNIFFCSREKPWKQEDMRDKISANQLLGIVFYSKSFC